MECVSSFVSFRFPIVRGHKTTSRSRVRLPKQITLFLTSERAYVL